ncbi:hypothetical protein C9426_15680 [Serratia sp. S1B]|nr:hypothetical protein C9426_15680 [Serratia sp. S1B]
MKTPSLAEKKVDSSAGKRIICLPRYQEVSVTTLFNNLSDNLCGHSQDDIQLLRQQKNIKS